MSLNLEILYGVHVLCVFGALPHCAALQASVTSFVTKKGSCNALRKLDVTYGFITSSSNDFVTMLNTEMLPVGSASSGR